MICGALVALPALAQTTTPAAAPAAQEDDLIVVTGSRIARPDLESTSPLAVVSDEEFRLSGAVNVEQVINTLPQVVPGVTAFSNNPGGGVSTLNLRGIGAVRTLVLVNGRRYVSFDTSQIVDLNTIPQFLIDGVDVVTGGASAVYGSDAIAGVVNFRLKNDLQGFQIGSQYAITGEGDGQRWDTNIAFGTEFAEGRGHATVYASYFDRKPVFQRDRDFSFFALGDGEDELVPLGSGTTNRGRFSVPATAVSGRDPDGSGPLLAPTLPRGAGNFTFFPGGTPNAFGADFAQPGISSPYDNPADSYNYAPENYLQVPQERWTLGGYADFEINRHLTLFTEVTYINNRVRGELAPTPVTGTLNFRLSAIQPFLSAADFAALQRIDANETAINAARTAAGLSTLFGPTRTGGLDASQAGIVQLSTARRINETGSRVSNDERNAFRVLVGARGEINDDWNYDAYYQYARTRNANIQNGNISRSAYSSAAENGRINIFGPNTITPEGVDEISILAQNGEESVLQVATASVSGQLFDFGMGGDRVGVAFGVEWRSVDARFIPDTALASGDVVGFNAGNPTSGGYQVREGFGEIRVPIIADRPFFDSLEVTGAVRYSDYTLEQVGGVWTWAAGATWGIIPDIQLRGSYQQATRAPNVNELFAGNFNNFPSATDPCSNRGLAANRTPAVRTLCEQTGVPPALVFTSGIQPNAQIETLGGGNPFIEEETADTWSVGAVITPTFLPGLNITVDYFNIKVEDFVSSFGGGLAGVLNLCYLQLQDINSVYCQALTTNSLTGAPARNPQTGEIGGQFLPFIGNANVAKLETAGIDFQLDYGTDLPFGLLSEETRFSMSFLGTWTRKNEFQPVVDDPFTQECAGNFGNVYCGNPQPSWKHSARFTFTDGPATVSLRWRYLGSATDEEATVDYVVEELDSVNYFDLSVAYDFNDQFTLTLGVNNLMNKEPQQLGDNQEQANTYPGVYDVLGRDFFVAVTGRF